MILHYRKGDVKKYGIFAISPSVVPNEWHFLALHSEEAQHVLDRLHGHGLVGVEPQVQLVANPKCLVLALLVAESIKTSNQKHVSCR